MHARCQRGRRTSVNREAHKRQRNLCGTKRRSNALMSRRSYISAIRYTATARSHSSNEITTQNLRHSATHTHDDDALTYYNRQRSSIAIGRHRPRRRMLHVRLLFGALHCVDTPPRAHPFNGNDRRCAQKQTIKKLGSRSYVSSFCS